MSYVIYGALQLALVVLWTQRASSGTRASVANAIVRLVGAVSLGALSFAEHQRTVHPSLILNCYLLLSFLLDAVNVRTLWLRTYGETVAIVTTISFAVKLVLVVLEALGKESILLDPFKFNSPEVLSGIYNRALFWWLNPLFREGYFNILSIKSLFPLDKHLSTKYLYDAVQPAWSRDTVRKPRALFDLFVDKLKWHLLAAVPYRLALIGFTYCQPFLINMAIEVSSDVSPQTTNSGYGLIGAYFLVYTGIAITTGQYQHLTFRGITMARGGLISLLFEKVATMDSRSVDPGSSTTLMSADIERIATGGSTVHDIWSSFIEIGLSIYLLYVQLGAACGIPIAVAVVSFGGALVITGLVVARQAKWLEAVERRIHATTNMLGSMKRVKMTGLVGILENQLQTLRIDELCISKKFRHLLIWNLGLAYTTPVIAPILTFAVFSILSLRSDGTQTLDTAKAFTALSLFALMADPLALIIMALMNFMGALGCFQRIQDFLQAKEHVDYRTKPGKAPPAEFKNSQHSVSTVSADDSEKTLPVTGREKSVVIQAGKFTNDPFFIEEGNFGWNAEKEPLLHFINLEAPRGELTVVVGPVGCGKSTLLKAILGEVPILSGMIHVPNVNIAYCDQAPFHTNGTIRDSIVAYSKFEEEWYRTVLEACALNEDLRTLPRGDSTIIGSKGIALSGGQSQRVSLARAVYARLQVCMLDDVLSGLDTDTENTVFHSLLGQDGLLRNHGTTVILASSSAKRLPYADHIMVLGKNGHVLEQGTFDDLNAQGGYVSSLNLRMEKTLEAKTPKMIGTQSTSSKSTITATPSTSVLKTEDDMNRQTGDIAIYLYYVRSVGWPATIIFIAAIVIYVFCYSFPSIWLKWWADANAKAPNQNLGLYLGVYAGLGVAALIALTVSCWQLVVTMVPLSGENFHRKLLTSVLGAPMSFFSTVDTGVTLNRFSQDLQLIDMDLPLSALNFFVTFVLCLAQIILIGVSTSYAAISFPFLFGGLYLIQKFYLRTSRQLRFLDLEAKSPLYAQFVETLSGLVTIRAFGWQRALEKKNWYLLDESQKPYYLMWAVQRWLTLVLDMIVAAIAVLLSILVVALRGFLTPGFAGVALVNVVLFSQQLRLLMTFFTQMETHIGAISRVKAFTNSTTGEDLPEENGQAPPTWPDRGVITFKALSATYDGSHKVLKDISFSIAAGQKVAICGRTGSGKTSLVMAIFRMVQTTGSIVVDGINLATLPRQVVRERVVGLPQDAFLLTGSVRLNVDPFGRISDPAIADALRDVGLWDVIEAGGGLDANVDDVHLSHGQKQLFSLAQAIVRPSPILILDEATSR